MDARWSLGDPFDIVEVSDGAVFVPNDERLAAVLDHERPRRGAYPEERGAVLVHTIALFGRERPEGLLARSRLVLDDRTRAAILLDGCVPLLSSGCVRSGER